MQESKPRPPKKPKPNKVSQPETIDTVPLSNKSLARKRQRKRTKVCVGAKSQCLKGVAQYGRCILIDCVVAGQHSPSMPQMPKICFVAHWKTASAALRDPLYDPHKARRAARERAAQFKPKDPEVAAKYLQSWQSRDTDGGWKFNKATQTWLLHSP
eukprot:5567819-Amphidinium_carterae.1